MPLDSIMPSRDLSLLQPGLQIDLTSLHHDTAYRQICSMPPIRPPIHLFRPTFLLSSHPARYFPPPRPSAARTLASTHPPDVSEHPSPDTASHESHYDPPSGWLFGIPPGEKYKNEGWENAWVYGFWGSLLLGIVAYAYKPDTS